MKTDDNRAQYDIWGVNYKEGRNVHKASLDDADEAFYKLSHYLMMYKSEKHWYHLLIDRVSGLCITAKDGHPTSVSSSAPLAKGQVEYDIGMDFHKGSIPRTQRSDVKLDFKLYAKMPWVNEYRLLTEHCDKRTAEEAAVAIRHAFSGIVDFSLMIKDHLTGETYEMRNLDYY